MKCSEAGRIIRNEPDTAISEDKDLASHVRTCPHCSKKYSLILKLSAALAEKETISLPADFEDKVWEKIGEPNPSFPFIRAILKPRWAFAVAAAAAAVVLLFVMPAISRKAAVNAPVEIAAEEITPQKTVKQDVTEPVKAANEGAPVIAAEGSAAPQEQQKTAPAAGVKELQLTGDTYKPNPLIPSANSVPVKAGNEIASASLNTVEKEMTALYTKEEDELRGDVAVYNNIFHPLQGESVRVRYRVKGTENIIVTVYDRKGAVVKKLFNGERGAGIYTEEWNGTGENGVISGNGIYIIYLKTGSAENKIKVGLIK